MRTHYPFLLSVIALCGLFTATQAQNNVGVDVPAPAEKLHIDGRLRLNVNNVAGAPAPATGGVIRWNGSDFEGWNGSAWVSLTSVSETDPIFTASPAGGITAGNITNWNTAFGWGDHASVGYLTTINGLTGSAQTIQAAISGAVLTPTFNSVGTTHTLQIPMASTASVTAGLLSNAEYTNLLNGLVGPGTVNQTARHNGTGWVASSAMVNDGSNVGIGATTPITRLDVAGNGYLNIGSGSNRVIGRFAQGTGSTGGGIEVVGRRGTATTSSFIDFKNISGSEEYVMGRVAGMNGASGETGNLTFWTNNGAASSNGADLAERMRITNDGTVRLNAYTTNGFVRTTGGTGTLTSGGPIATTEIADNAVTNVKLADMPANTVKANPTAATADPTDLVVGANTVLGRQGGNIVAAQVATAQIANNAVDGTKIDLTGNANGDLMYYNGTDWLRLASGTSGQVLRTNGLAAPTWTDPGSVLTGGTGITIAGNTINSLWTANATHIHSNNTGNVGIGIASPVQKLHVVGQIAVNDNNTRILEGAGNSVRVQTNSGYVDLGPQNGSWSHFQTDLAQFYFNKRISVDEGIISAYGSNNMQLQTGTTTRMTILNSNGNVGINVTAPIRKLDILTGTSTEGMVVRSATTATNVAGHLWPGSGGFVIDARLGNLTGAANLHLRTGGTDRIYVRGSNGNVGIHNSNPQAALHVSGDFYNQEIHGVTNSANQDIAYNASNVEINTGGYATITKGDGTGVDGSAILVVASVTVSGNTITFADGVGGYQQVNALANGMASFAVTLQRRINGGGWTSLISQSAICGLAVGDWYLQYNNIPTMSGIKGDMFRFPNSVSISYFDAPGNGTVEYRLIFTHGGFRKNGGSYRVTGRNLTAVQIKR